MGLGLFGLEMGEAENDFGVLLIQFGIKEFNPRLLNFIIYKNETQKK